MESEITEGGTPSLAGSLAVYSALRILLIVALTAALMGISALFDIGMPLLMAALLAIILQLPLAWVIFAKYRRRVNNAIAAKTAHRRAERTKLEDRLHDGES